MIYRITPQKDTTIYERSTNLDRTLQNTGLDSILELIREKHSIAINGAFSSRVLIQFDIGQLSGYSTLYNRQFWLKLYKAEYSSFNSNVDICVHEVLEDWDNGIGTFNDSPLTTNGASWENRIDDTVWTSGSGGTFDSSSCSVHENIGRFDEEDDDLYVNVTDICESWISGTSDNHGFMVKHTQSAEENENFTADLKWFSAETNTIYQPKLEVKWDDSSGSFETGSLTALDLEESTVYPIDLRSKYSIDSKVKIRVAGLLKYPTKTYVTESSTTITNHYLPATSYYSIVDMHTNEEIIPFDTNYTKLSCDSTSNYFNLYMDQFEPGRYYKIKFKVVESDLEYYFDHNFKFKVTK